MEWTLGADQQGVTEIDGRWLTIPRTLCFVRYKGEVLLMKRSPTRRIFPNLYNGVGGHIERWEDPYQAATREILEETGLEVRDLRLRGIHNIDVGADNGIMMFVFTATTNTSDFVDPGVEGTLHWIPVESIDTLDLVEDLPFVLPRILAMRLNDPPYYAHVSYDDSDTIRIQFSNESR